MNSNVLVYVLELILYNVSSFQLLNKNIEFENESPFYFLSEKSNSINIDILDLERFVN